jgi:hypothetical protein
MFMSYCGDRWNTHFNFRKHYERLFPGLAARWRCIAPLR